MRIDSPYRDARIAYLYPMYERFESVRAVKRVHRLQDCINEYTCRCYTSMNNYARFTIRHRQLGFVLRDNSILHGTLRCLLFCICCNRCIFIESTRTRLTPRVSPTVINVYTRGSRTFGTSCRTNKPDKFTRVDETRSIISSEKAYRRFNAYGRSMYTVDRRNYGILHVTRSTRSNLSVDCVNFCTIHVTRYHARNVVL